MEQRVRGVSRARTASSTSCATSRTSSASARASTATSASSRPLAPAAAGRGAWRSSSGPDGADEDLAVHLSEGRRASPRARSAAWARRSRLDERASTRGRARCELADGRRARDRALRPTRRYQVRVRPLDLRAALRPARPRELLRRPPLRRDARVAPRRSPDHIALVLQDRSIRAQIAGALRAQPRARRDARPDPRDLQRPEAQPHARRPLPVDRLGRRPRASASSAVVLSLYDRERTSSSPRAHFGLDERWAEIQGAGRPRRGDHAALDRPQPGLQVVPRARAPTRGRARPAIASSRRVARGRRRRLAARRAALDPARTPEDRLLGCLSRRRAAQRAGRRRSRRSARSRSSPTRPSPRSRTPAPTTRPASSRIRDSPDRRLQPPPLPGVLQRELGRAERLGTAR